MFIVLQMTIFQRSLAVYLGPLVEPPPCMECKDVINAPLYFRFKDRLTRQKRQGAYNVQKACYTLFFYRTNGNAVRVCDSSVGNGVTSPRAALPGGNSIEHCVDLSVLE